MLALLGTTLAASFVDSLNPSAIAQQLLLQAMAPKKRNVLFFILGIASANFLLGIAVYYGIAAQLMRLWEHAQALYPRALSLVEILCGAVLLVLGILLFLRTHRRSRRNPAQAAQAKPIGACKPAPLFLMGAGFCAVELTSALPYFGFLAALAGYHLAPPAVLAMICLYTLIYSAPLIVLYFAYNQLRKTNIIARAERALNRIAAYILPAAAVLLGAVLTAHGGSSLPG